MRRAVGALACLALIAVLAPRPFAEMCPECEWTPFWPVPSDHWRTSTSYQFPEETRRANGTPRVDFGSRESFGVAFSGGGTRSATATAGQLRGLHHNGWLDKAKYVTAVSGGSWAAAPYIYGNQSIDVLLGRIQPLDELTPAAVRTAPESALLRSIVASKIAPSGVFEAASFLSRQRLGERELFGVQLQGLLDKVFGIRGSSNQTYADIIGKLFIVPHVPFGTDRMYSWDEYSVNEILENNSRLSTTAFVKAASNRPFLIVGGTVISTLPVYDRPRLAPIEMTPLYSGVRQRFGQRLGGGYVWPMSYDSEAADLVRGDMVRTVGRGADRRFTLADMIGTSGSAPLLGLFRGKPVEAAARYGPQFFPAFNHFTVRDGQAMATALGLSHGDGGFTDNTGVMPLLARQVKNIIVFVNGAHAIGDDIGVESLFHRVDRFDDWGGDRSINEVFDLKRWAEVQRGLGDGQGDGANVFCGRNWKVKSNETYNIREYDGLNICFVNSQRIDGWRSRLPCETQKLLSEDKKLRDLPWFSTFEENKPRLIKLEEEQVNLMASLSTWAVTNDQSRKLIAEALDLPYSPGPAPAAVQSCK